MSSFYIKTYGFDHACLPGDMARACSLSLMSFPQVTVQCKIATMKYSHAMSTDVL